MKIQKVCIDGFKNLSEVDLVLDDITAIVSVNNYGKSNVLKAIDFGLDFIKASMDDRIHHMSNSNLMPMNNNLLGRNFKFEIETKTSINDSIMSIIYGYEFEWKSGKEQGQRIVAEYLKLKTDEKNQKYTQVINRNYEKVSYKSSESGRCSTRLSIEPVELAINKLRAFDNLYYIDVIKKLNNLKFYMETSFDADTFYRPDPIISKGIGNMAINSDNLPRIIYHLQKENRSKFNILKNTFCSLFPSIEDIIVRQFRVETGTNKLPDDAPFAIANSVYVLFVKDKNLIRPLNFSSMSDGAKRVFLIFTRILLANAGNVSLIAIEEPENSVHPGLFRDYIQIIGQLLDDCKIIITSHSPYIISYLNPAWIHVGISAKSGVAEFHSFTKAGIKALVQDALELGMSTGDYLFSMLADNSNEWTRYLE